MTLIVLNFKTYRESTGPEALRLAADFTLACIQVTCRDPNAPWYGVEFEKALHLLPGLLEG